MCDGRNPQEVVPEQVSFCEHGSRPPILPLFPLSRLCSPVLVGCDLEQSACRLERALDKVDADLRGENPVREEPQWRQHVNASGPFPAFEEALQISFFFAGIGGAERAFMESNYNWPFTVAQRIDICKHVIPALQKLENFTRGIHHCKVEPMDIETMRDCDFKSCHAVIATPPCPSFSKLGTRSIFESADGKLFLRTLEVVKMLAYRCDGALLQWALFENVEGVIQKSKGSRTSAFDILQKEWLRNNPDFTPLQPWRVNTLETSLPQSRNRVYLVTFRKTVTELAGLPTAPLPHPKVNLDDFLLDGEQANALLATANRLTAKMRSNIRKYQQLDDIKNWSGLVVVDACRDIKLKYTPAIGWDYCTVLTTKNSYLYVSRGPLLLTSNTSTVHSF